METRKSKEKLPVIDFGSRLPDSIRGIKKLDKTLFDISINVPVLKCPNNLCGKAQKEFQNVIFNRPHFRKIIPYAEEENKYRLLLIHPEIKSEDILTENQRDFIKQHECSFFIHELDLTYNDFYFDEILRKVFPEETKDIVSSFETIGHIAHLNLKPSMLDFKYLIGEVLLDKNKHIKTVVNKTNTIEETFRFFKMELLAGEDRMMATVQEHGCIFEFDYSKVYWNSRLQTEHQRIVNLINSDDTVYDVFAGVGPFSIPIAKKTKKVYSNDLNTESYKALLHNAKLNKVNEQIKAHNMDGRQFIENIVIGEGLCNVDTCINHKSNTHIIMNLPAIAPEFLDVFSEKYRTFSLPIQVHKNIFVHCYCFCTSKEPEGEAIIRISEILSMDVSPSSQVHFVRRVAPNKVMMCVTFNLTWFQHNVEKCCCNEDTLDVISMKRPIEGQSLPADLGKRRRTDGPED